jgi:hypothetical protein
MMFTTSRQEDATDTLKKSRSLARHKASLHPSASRVVVLARGVGKGLVAVAGRSSDAGKGGDLTIGRQTIR